MVKRYDEQFKVVAIACLEQIQKGNTIKIGKDEVTSVRGLLRVLNMKSHDTLYRWNKEIILHEKAKKIEVEIIEKKEEEIEEEKEEEKEEEGYDNTHLVVPIDDLHLRLGIGWFKDFARALGVRNYSNMNLPMLHLACGNKLIEKSGLVRNGGIKK